MSCHKLVRCQNLGNRRTSENQAGQGVNLGAERTKDGSTKKNEKGD